MGHATPKMQSLLWTIYGIKTILMPLSEKENAICIFRKKQTYLRKMHEYLLPYESVYAIYFD